MRSFTLQVKQYPTMNLKLTICNLNSMRMVCDTWRNQYQQYVFLIYRQRMCVKCFNACSPSLLYNCVSYRNKYDIIIQSIFTVTQWVKSYHWGRNQVTYHYVYPGWVKNLLLHSVVMTCVTKSKSRLHSVIVTQKCWRVALFRHTHNNLKMGTFSVKFCNL